MAGSRRKPSQPPAQGESSQTPREESSGNTAQPGESDAQTEPVVRAPYIIMEDEDRELIDGLQPPSKDRLQELRERLQRLKEEEEIMEQTIALYQRRYGESLEFYLEDVATYIRRRDAAKARSKRRRPSTSSEEDEPEHESTRELTQEPEPIREVPMIHQMLSQRAKIVEPDP